MMDNNTPAARGRHTRKLRPERILGPALVAATLALLLTACGAGPRRAAEAPTPEAAAASTTAAYAIDSVVSLRGRVVLAHEVRAFIPEGDTTEYWIVDRSGALERAYDSVTVGQKNGLPACAGLKVRYKGPSDEGFAADYEGVFEVVEVLSVTKAGE